MISIQLPGEQAAALSLTLDNWLRNLAATEAVAVPAHPRKERYSLAELTARCDPSAPESAGDRAWLEAPAMGREAL